jgi:hypothetical protein
MELVTEKNKRVDKMKKFLFLLAVLFATNAVAQDCFTPAHNLLGYSDDMTSSTGWSKVATITDDTAATRPPAKIYNVNKVFKAASGASQTSLQTGAAGNLYVVNGSSYVLTIFAKYSNLQYLGVGITGSGGTYMNAFDIQNGVVGTNQFGSNITITAAGDSWWKIKIPFTGVTAIGTSFRLRLIPLNSNVYTDTKTTAGTEIVYYTAPQIQNYIDASTEFDKYIPTTTFNAAWGVPRNCEFVRRW